MRNNYDVLDENCYVKYVKIVCLFCVCQMQNQENLKKN